MVQQPKIYTRIYWKMIIHKTWPHGKLHKLWNFYDPLKYIKYLSGNNFIHRKNKCKLLNRTNRSNDNDFYFVHFRIISVPFIPSVYILAALRKFSCVNNSFILSFTHMIASIVLRMNRKKIRITKYKSDSKSGPNM